MNTAAEQADLGPGGIAASFDRRPIAVSRIFASARHETRIRRPVDVAVLLTSVLTVLLAAWASDAGVEFDTWVADIFDDAPGWMRTLA
ncbi:MAG: hypothetical protein KDB37_15485, partial [Ilumatobacter sp.]|nr:hypothetical protein [Ilumatobacter sp.]